MNIVYMGNLYESVDTTSLDSLVETLKREYNIQLRMYDYGNGIIKLDNIVVPKDNRKSGVGTKAMEAIIQFADKNNKKIILSPADKHDGLGTTSKSRLIDFYKRFGFKLNKGSNKDYSISELMYREPKQATTQIDKPEHVPTPRVLSNYGSRLRNIPENVSKWFGDSVVVDKTGKPIEVYHGSPDIRFTKNGEKFISRSNQYFFTDNYKTATTYRDVKKAFDHQNAVGGVLKAYLKIENPLVIDADKANWRETEHYIDVARRSNKDGVIFINSEDSYNNFGKNKTQSTVFVVFNADQILLV